jgi:hypothetical protein
MIEILDGVLIFNGVVVVTISCLLLAVIFYDTYLAFLLSIALALSFGNETLLQSKVGFLGLIDLSLFISIISFVKFQFLDPQKSKLIVPLPAIACITVLVIGFSISLVRYDDLYISIRALRWAIGLPIYFIITANIVNTRQKIKALLIVLLLASALASIQHLFWIAKARFNYDISSNANVFRNIGFLRNQDIFLVAGPFFFNQKIPHIGLQIGLAVLFLVTFLTQQTRSILIGTILGAAIFYIQFLKFKFSLKKIISILLVLSILAIITTTSLQVSGLSNLAGNYFTRLSGTFNSEADKPGNMDENLTRKNAFEKETDDWLQGNIIFGEGLFYYQREGYGFKGFTVTDADMTAYGHLGYIAYLSQLGIIGFVVYGFWLPISVLLKAKKILKVYHTDPILKYFASLTAITFLSSMVTFLFSASFIVSYVTIPGILAGVVWRFSKLKKQKVNYHEFSTSEDYNCYPVL